jgi:hypothetical protein
MRDPVRHEADESPQQDPRIEQRRLEVKLDALRRRMAEERIETPGRLRTIFDELRWRRELRRSLSGRMTATTWIIAFVFLSVALLAVIVGVKIY